MGATDGSARPGDVDAVINRMRDAAAARGHDDGPGAPGTVDADVLRTVLATLPHDDQRLLWAHHVRRRDVGTIAAELGSHARVVGRRLRRAERRLAAAFAAAHARACPPGCLEVRTALHEYAGHRLAPRRRTVLEEHLFGCDGCMRAFIDVRQASWALRDAAPLLLTGAVAAGAGPVVVGATAAGSAGGAGVAGLGSLGAALAGGWEWLRAQVLRLGGWGRAGLVGAGTVAAVVVASFAVALVTGGAPTGAVPVVAASGSPAPSAGATNPEPTGPADDGSTGDGSTVEGATGNGATDEVEPAPSDAGTTGPSTLPPQDPTTDGDPGPAEPAPTDSPAGQGDTGFTGSASEPARSATPDESPAARPTTTPTAEPAPTTTPGPTPQPTTTPAPLPSAEPTSPVEATTRSVTLAVPASTLPRLYLVVPTGDDARVVRVTTSDPWLTPFSGARGWYVGGLGRAGSVVVEVEAAAGAAPGARLERLGRWHD
ncbi:hypothetical protein GCM10009809_20950 [Isoptericola hypogeus]|uniref:Putative zinc-finger domain-containing protein n=1 Tax=Isoptericola hypogeus TaxID=300179 RepID=A0ABN2JF60_9MICO